MRTALSLLTADAVAGAAIEGSDLTAARVFYEKVLADVPGEWREDSGALTLRAGGQALRIVEAPNPPTLGETARHQAYPVRPDRLRPLADHLAGEGFALDWWREDHPAERDVTAYVLDPSGNRVQLVPQEAPALPVDHATIEVHDLETAEVFYLKALGGVVDYYHGRSVDDYVQAAAWGEGSDPCAPWTRLWPGGGLSTNPAHRGRASHPTQQIFVRFGADRLGIMLTPEHRQEPPEGQLRGMPYLTLRTSLSADQAAAALDSRVAPLEPEGRISLDYEREGSTLFLRDPGGNFVALECAL